MIDNSKDMALAALLIFSIEEFLGFYDYDWEEKEICLEEALLFIPYLLTHQNN